MVLCLLAADEEDNQDVALQIHFTLIQAFCCENDINILRVSNPSRLAELLLLGASGGGDQPADLHCVLVTVSAVLCYQRTEATELSLSLAVWPLSWAACLNRKLQKSTSFSKTPNSEYSVVVFLVVT